MKRSKRAALGAALIWGFLGETAGFAAPAVAGPTSEKTSLDYVVTLTSPARERVEIAATLTDTGPGTVARRWVMPQRFAFVRLPEPVLEGAIEATVGDKPQAVKRTGAYEWEVEYAGPGALTLKYAVPLTHRALDAVKQRDAYEYPYVADDHGLLVTPTLFVFPEGVVPDEIRVRFDLPAGWEVTAPWQRIDARTFDPGRRDALLNDLVAIGRWKVHEIEIDRFVGTVAFAPGQDALEVAAVEPIRSIVAHELKLFGRPAEGRYLFVFGRPETTGMAGSPKTNSMTLSVEPRLASAVEQYLPHLIAHEFFHTWTAAVETPDELRWVGEGFTDYYAWLVAARLGLGTWEEFAATLGEEMRQCAANPRRGELSLVEAGGEVFFSDRNAYDLIYDGGLLIAAWLDRAIRAQKRGSTLDDLMRAFNNDLRWRNGSESPALSDFLAVARRFADGATAAALERFVTQPYAFDPVDAFGRLGLVIRREIKPPEMDLRANLEGTRVTDIDRNWITYQVGVRENDRLLKVNGQSVGDTREVRAAWRSPRDGRIRVTLERGGETVEIDEALPQVEQFVVPADPWREHQ